MPTKTISKDRMREEAKTTRPTPPGPELSSGALIGLRIISTGEIISLIGRDNYTLGRSIDGQAILPDVDLSRFDAYDFGLSRMHAELRIDEQEPHIVDLESANGTIVNGKRILPNQPEPLEHGDIIQLGRLRMQVISRIK
ncbi:MAG: FHA domain-containing protein [Anaerolineales bacterium]|nr:FHA domain-containing protein [Anaerolineales bacterium]